MFTSVFGASDEVLGQIEDGLDFEKNIASILDRCKTSEEINAAFEELEKKYSHQINLEMKKTRSKVFDNLDPQVRDKLKTYDAQTGVVLNAFERLLIRVTRHELEPYASFNPNGTQFNLHNAPASNIPTGEYFFKSEPRKGTHQYRFNSNLASWVLNNARDLSTPDAHLTFRLSNSTRVSTLAKKLKNKSGRMKIQEIAFTMSAGKEGLKESYLLMVGFLDDDTVLDAEQMRDLLDLTCVQERITAVPEDGFSELIDKQISDLSNDVQERNAVFYLQQEELIEAARLDLKAAFDAKIREFHAKENTASKAARKASDVMEKLRLTREARHWQNKAEQADDEYRQERNRLHAKSEKFLNKVEKSLQAKHEVQDLFTIS